MVGEINSQIKQRKNRLAPQIKELRALRTKFQELETEYLDKKGHYDSIKAGLDSDLTKVQAEADAAAKEAAHEEGACHYYESAASIERIKLKRAQDERAGLAGRGSASAARLTRDPPASRTGLLSPEGRLSWRVQYALRVLKFCSCAVRAVAFQVPQVLARVSCCWLLAHSCFWRSCQSFCCCCCCCLPFFLVCPTPYFWDARVFFLTNFLAKAVFIFSVVSAGGPGPVMLFV